MPFPELTPREPEMLDLLAAGLNNAVIAARLEVAPKTVANNVSAIFAKLQVADRAQAIIRARDAGLGRHQRRRRGQRDMRFDGAMSVDHRPQAAGELVLRTVPFTHPEVQRLVEEVQAHYVVIYGGPDDSPVDPTEFAAPQGLFVLGSVGGRGVAMGGWRRRPDLADRFDGEGVAEVKRMYVAPAGRRRGYARRLLGFLEESARRAGVGRFVLETGTMQPDAIALYEAAGYLPTIRFGHYADSPLSRYYAKRLDG